MTSAPRSNLQLRVITALVMAAVVIATLYTGSTLAWALLVLVFCAAAAWEWLRLAQSAAVVWRALSVVALVALLAVAALAILKGQVELLPLIVVVLVATAVFWLVLVPWQLNRLRIGLGGPLGWLAMPLAIGAAWISAVALQRQSVLLLLAVVVLTVAADVGGYVFGRAFGKHKLAPAISPGKTREGALGGIAAASLWAVFAMLSLSVIPAAPLPIALAAIAGALLGVFAVMGDLYESQLKRQAGVKDSSNLLPGHGGVLDRIDAQLAVLPLATLLLHWVKPLW
jgi:phosphatidate cytidylyltransferase